MWRSIHSQPRPVIKTRSFVAQRHDDIRNLLTSLLSKVCKDVEIEPHLLPIDNKVFNLRSTVTSPEARLDIKAGSFWSRGETASFHVRVTHVNSTCNQNKSTELILVEHEQEKKGKHQHRVIDVEMGSFNSLFFATNGGMWKECKICLRNLADKLPERAASLMPVPYLGLEHGHLLRSVHTCVPGSRTPFYKNAR